MVGPLAGPWIEPAEPSSYPTRPQRLLCIVVGEDGSVVFFGRIWPYKGLEYLIRAEPLIAQAVPGVRSVIAGRGEDFDRYRGLMLNADSWAR